jgi:hypothetical protein
MGVDRIDYIVYGWKLPYKIEGKNGKINIWDDKFLPLIEGRQGEKHFICVDGMCGKYVVFGILIDSSDDYEGWTFQELNIHTIENNFDNELKNRYIDLFESEPQSNPKLLIFSHFS